MVASIIPSTTVAAPAFNTQPSVGQPTDANKKTDTKLFTPSKVRGVTFQNRIVVPPMCMYSATGGFINDYHIAHYGSLAVRGPGLIIIEATAVESRGRLSPDDLGLWSDEHIDPLKHVVDLIKSQGVVPGIQLGHAGRKANMGSQFSKGGYHALSEQEGGWPNDVVGPSDYPFDSAHNTVKALSVSEMKQVTQKFVDAAVRADKAGIEVLEIHAAHGYLLNNYLSGNSNKRTDEYGGSLENRLRYPLEVVKAVRDVWPQEKPLWVRVSATEFKSTDVLGHDEEGWDVYQTIEFAKKLKEIGVDTVDVSAGGTLSNVQYPAGPLYQVPLADAIKQGAGIATGAVGIITEPKQAESILQENKADYVLIGREHLRNPAWTQRAASELGVSVRWSNQYLRANREKL